MGFSMYNSYVVHVPVYHCLSVYVDLDCVQTHDYSDWLQLVYNHRLAEPESSSSYTMIGHWKETTQFLQYDWRH